MQTSKYTTLAWYPILAVGLSMVSFIMIKTGRDGVFFQDDGLRQLPMAYIWIAVVAVPAAILHLYALERWGARRTRTVLFGLTAGLFLAFAPFVHPAYSIMMTILFILVPTCFAAVFAAAWLLASDLLEGAAPDLLRQVYTRIGAASMLGGIVGGVLSKAVTTYLEPPYLLVSGALVLLVAGLVVARAHRHNPIQHLSLARPNEPEPAPATRFADSSSVLIKHTYVRVLIGISVVASIAALYIDFQFYATATLSGRNNPQFFANFYIILNTLSLAIQLFVAPRLQAKLGLSGAGVPHAEDNRCRGDP